MERSAINNKLTDIFRKTFSDTDLSLQAEMTAKDVDNWDSLSHMLMINEVENAFAIKFKLKELNKLKNVGVLIELIENKLS